MSLKILKFESTAARLVLPAIGVVCLATAWFFVKWDFVNAVSYRGIDIRLPDARMIADWLPQTAPDDPQAYLAGARYFERTFEPEDLAKSMHNYEAAVAASPSHYSLWLLLGQARDRNGDDVGAEAAYLRALQLAPAYAAVHWAYGNSLIRHGRSDEGFRLIAQAAGGDPTYSDPSVSIALQAFDGNADEVRRALGDSPATNAALANVFARQRKYHESFEAWSHLGPDDRVGNFKDTGQRLLGLTYDAHEMRIAAAVFGDMITDNSDRPAIGSLTNGGFENGVKLRNAGIFEWQISQGSEPQIGLSEGVKRSGRYSLWMTFNSFDPSAFRTIWQPAAVVPGATYQFEGFYRADIKSNAAFRWEILDAVSGGFLAMTEPLTLAGDWTSMRAKFTVPATSDGVVIRFVRLGCGGGACPVTGKISFDDLSIKQL